MIPVRTVEGDGRSLFEMSSGPDRFARVKTGVTPADTWIFDDLKTVGKVVCRKHLATLLRSKGNDGPSISVAFSFIFFGEENWLRNPAYPLSAEPAKRICWQCRFL